MATLDDLRQNRQAKLKTIERTGIWPYPLDSKRTHSISEVYSNWNKLQENDKEVIIVGRLMSLRKHGGMIFADLEDSTDRIQNTFKKRRPRSSCISIF